MAKQLVPDAKPYCLWQTDGGGFISTMCDMDYYERIEVAEKRDTCPLCERPIRLERSQSNPGGAK